MDDRAVGQHAVGARCVVIGDDHVHAGGPSGGDLVDRGDAAVHGHDQRGAALGQALHGGRGQAVAVVDAAGQEPARLGAEAAQGPDHDRGGAHAVDVVVAVNDDGPTGGDVAADEIERLLDAVKSGRVVGLPGLEEAPGRRRIGQPAAHEDLCEHVAHPQIALQGQRVGGVIGRDLEPRDRILSAETAAARPEGQPQRGAGGVRFSTPGGERWCECGGLSHRAPM